MTSEELREYQLDLVRIRAREKKVFAYLRLAVSACIIIWALLSLG